MHRLLQDILHWQGFIGSERCAMIAFSEVFNLLNIIRWIASGYSVMLQGDVASIAFQSFVVGLQQSFIWPRRPLHAVGHSAQCRSTVTRTRRCMEFISEEQW